VSSSNPFSAEHYYRNQSLLKSPVAYEAFFGLNDNPFSLTPDPRYLVRTRNAHETLRQLTRGILARKGLILLSGEVGTGKTTLLNSALQTLRENPGSGNKTRTAVLLHPTLSREEFIEAILTDFQIPCEVTRMPYRLQILSEMLLEVRRNRGIAVLAVDEAQLLSPDLLDEIRMLLEMHGDGEELLQVVLCGHPELEEKLASGAYASLQSEATVHCSIAPLSVEDTTEYIAHRMRVAGAKNESIFTPGACLAANHHSGGIPRVVNILCTQALAIAASQGAGHVTSHMIGEAAKKLPFPDDTPRGPQTRMRGSTGAPPTPPPISRRPLTPTPPLDASTSRPQAAAQARVARIARQPEAYPLRHRRRLYWESAKKRAKAFPAKRSAENFLTRLRKNPAARGWNQRMEAWWSARLDRRQYYSFALLNVGMTGAVLLLLAQGPIPTASWEHTVQSAVGFLGLLFLDVAIGLAGYMYLSRRLTPSQAQAPARFFWAAYRRLSAAARHAFLTQSAK
jgi:type II secretory pathway predicted ATPase ExeA